MTASPSARPLVRLALCITDLEVGGAERCLVEVATRLDRSRFSPVVYCLAGRPARPERSLVPPLEAAGIEVHCLGARRKSALLPAARRLAGLFLAERPHVVQTFLFHANMVGRLAAWWSSVPAVASGIRVAERRSRWRLWLDRWTTRLVDKHVCVSEAVARFSRVHGRLPAEQLVVIPNGIDVAPYDLALPADLVELGVPPGRRVVTYVGRLDPQKGLIDFIGHSPAWLDRLPRHDLLLVGEGPQRRSLEQLARRIGVSSRVRFAGWRGNVPGILRSSDLLVLPSKWEGMPNVILEAMASRLPVVARDVEGVGELVGPGAEIQIVSGRDPQVFADKIVAICSQPELATHLGARNRRRAAEHFSVDAMVGAYQRLFGELAGASGRRRKKIL